METARSRMAACHSMSPDGTRTSATIGHHDEGVRSAPAVTHPLLDVASATCDSRLRDGRVEALGNLRVARRSAVDQPNVFG